jgi:predicted DNA-binding protein
MALNKKTHVIVPVVMSIEMEKQLKELAIQSERSRSAQVITYVKEGIKKEIKEGEL